MWNRFLALILIIMVYPLFLFIAILIKIDSAGPVFFRQKRVGHKGKIFTCLKLRTMLITAPPNVAKIDLVDRDKLLTRVGRKLSSSGFDELPQLINILLGDMVFIGPRPVPTIEEEVHQLRQAKGIYQLKPGLTGWAQIQQDMVKNCFTPAEQVAHDKFYLENQSLWLDIKIVFLTLQVLLGGKHSH